MSKIRGADVLDYLRMALKPGVSILTLSDRIVITKIERRINMVRLYFDNGEQWDLFVTKFIPSEKREKADENL